MKSNRYNRLFLITTIGTAIPQILLLAISLIKPLWKFIDNNVFGLVILLLLIYDIIFSVWAGIKYKNYIDKTIEAISQFILYNFYEGLLFYVTLFMCSEFLLNDENFGMIVVVIICLLLIIISVLIFLATLIIANFLAKKRDSTNSLK